MKSLKIFIGVLLMCSFIFAQADFEKRAQELVNKMTLEEKVGEMVNAAHGVPRLGIDPYNWWNECLHGVARNGIATVFPQAIGLASTWNTDLIYEVADVISFEGRAKHHEALRTTGNIQYSGLTFWTPNINIFRDPRWGRGQETYGEDPFLTSKIGVAFVKGIQGNDPKYFKAIATAKHYVVHSGPEPDRHHFDAILSKKDMFDTYMPAFEALVKEGKVYSIMGAYNRTNGEACCASDYLLNDILRKQWGFDGYVVSDCGAINDIWANHKLVATAPKAAAIAVKRGCELNCGGIYPHLIDAVKMGMITEKEIDLAVYRLMLARFKLGMFDDPADVPFADTPISINACEAHQKLSLKTARESIVLLKNENDLLPLSKDIKSIAVVGPNANDLDVLYGNYNGFAENPITILEGIKNRVGDKIDVKYAKGCDLAPISETNLASIPSKNLSTGDKKGLIGEYFNNMILDGKPVLTKTDKIIDFNWQASGAVEELGRDNYSIRWTGYLVPDISGTYLLGVKSDDGFRLYIDEKLHVESWRQQGATTYSEKIELKAGKKYKIKLEYFEKTGDASCQLCWKVPESEDFIEKQMLAQNEEALKITMESDVVVMVGGISPRLEGEEMRVKIDGFNGGDRTHLKLPVTQIELLKKLKETGKPVVLVLANGSALAINWSNENIPAILTVGYPGQEGGNAVADVLFGDYNPAGRLPVTYYKSVDDLPDFNEYAMKDRTYRYFQGDALYPFGYGLSFTDFQYKSLKLSDKKISDNDEITVKIKVRNNGNFDGDEVIQIYITKDKSKLWLENKRLVGFKRVNIKKGKTKEIEISVKAKDFRSFDEKLDKYVVEKGKYQILVGKSSEEILLTKEITVK